MGNGDLGIGGILGAAGCSGVLGVLGRLGGVLDPPLLNVPGGWAVAVGTLTAVVLGSGQRCWHTLSTSISQSSSIDAVPAREVGLSLADKPRGWKYGPQIEHGAVLSDCVIVKGQVCSHSSTWLRRGT